jgi:glycosyltransferase involved in cell wall biosynthesis
LYKYRAPFSQAVRNNLEKHDVQYHVVYSDPPNLSKLKDDTTELDWATKTAIYYFGPQKYGFAFQNALGVLRTADLIIMQQENKLLLNYLLHLRRFFDIGKLAYFGHGRNFQKPLDGGFGDHLKRYLATKVDWWFAYNDLSARIVESYGFPASRITSFRNSIDMRRLLAEVASISPKTLEERRYAGRVLSKNVGIFVGGVYPEKRLPFLIEAAKRIREVVPDFELLIVGGGPDLEVTREATSALEFIHLLGPIYGREKTELALLADVFLMPGLVGLAVLDSFAYGKPMFTTDYPYHSPEIDYLIDGVNGRIVRPWQDVDTYARAVIEFLNNHELRARLSSGASAAATGYSIEDMAERFSTGVLRALEPDQ